MIFIHISTIILGDASVPSYLISISRIPIRVRSPEIKYVKIGCFVVCTSYTTTALALSR